MGTYMLAYRSWPSSHLSKHQKEGSVYSGKSEVGSLVPVSPALQEEGAAFVVSRVKHTVVAEASNIAAE